LADFFPGIVADSWYIHSIEISFVGSDSLLASLPRGLATFTYVGEGDAQAKTEYFFVIMYWSRPKACGK
jgi:hypothetical protein